MSEALSLAALVAAGLPVRPFAGELSGVRVRAVHRDSREVEPGSLFVSLPSEGAEESLDYIDDAIARGAVAVISRRPLERGVPTLTSEEPALALALAAERVYGSPTSALVCVGVTGTNGKTTTTTLVEQALASLGAKPAVIGTGAHRFGGEARTSLFTTPFGDEISRFARDVLDRGATHLLMEISSHGLEQKRAHGVRFDVGAFTNLSQDHLDYHGSMDAYAAAKAKLFTELSPRVGVLQWDDPFAETLASSVRGALSRVSKTREVEVYARAFEATASGLRATLVTPQGEGELTSPLLGAHNLENLLVALGCLLAIDVPLDDALRALSSATGAKGRLERVDDPRGVAVAVDYAHTPDAIARVLAALRPATTGRLIIVFGCGGDRDRAKRPKMAEAARAGADLVVVTSDNPRTEAPTRIVDDILVGLEGAARPSPASLASASSGYVVEVDRRAAIELALRAAREGDTVLLAGKGHETYQIVGEQRLPFDDRLEAARVIAAITGGAS